MTAVNEQNPRRRVVTINASGGAVVTIQPSSPCRYMEVYECPPGGGTYNGANFAPQGTNYTRADESYATIYPLLPGQVLPFGDRYAPRDRKIGIPSGMKDPAGNSISQSMIATIQMISATAVATQVEVDEYD